MQQLPHGLQLPGGCGYLCLLCINLSLLPFVLGNKCLAVVLYLLELVVGILFVPVKLAA